MIKRETVLEGAKGMFVGGEARTLDLWITLTWDQIKLRAMRPTL
jgi:hypothetical protein